MTGLCGDQCLTNAKLSGMIIGEQNWSYLRFSCENNWNKLKQMFKRNNRGINWINGIDGVNFNNKI